MILTAQEYYDMGFSAEDEALLQDCLKRAEYVLSGITEGRAITTAASGGEQAEYVKQAAAFQASAIYRAEQQLRQSGGGGESSLKTTERVSIGDFSYSVGSAQSRSVEESSAVDTNMTVIRLLRAAGCLYRGTEARE